MVHTRRPLDTKSKTAHKKIAFIDSTAFYSNFTSKVADCIDHFSSGSENLCLLLIHEQSFKAAFTRFVSLWWTVWCVRNHCVQQGL